MAGSMAASQTSTLSVGVNPLGNTYYVDGATGDDTNGGLSTESAVATLAQVRTLSAAGDAIVIAPGAYTVDVGVGSLAPKANQTWTAAKPSYGGPPSVIIIADADDNANPAVAFDVNGCVAQGIEFKLVAGGTTSLYCLSAAQTTAIRGLVFEDCWFNLNDVDGAGIMACQFNDATNAITGLVMHRCRLVGGSATTNQAKYIEVGIGGIPDADISDCSFALESADGDCLGIDFLDPGASGKSYAHCIHDNRFIGPSDGGNDAVGVKFAAAMTDDEIVGLIANNTFVHCSHTPVTAGRMDDGIVNNAPKNEPTYTAVRATATLPQTTAHALFTITGGNVEILGLIGEVTTVIQALDNATKLTFNPTGAGGSTDLCTALNITADAVGTFYSLTGDTTDPMHDGLWIAQSIKYPFSAGPGTIDLDCAASNTGSVQWHVVYRRLEPAARIAAA